MPTRCKIFFTFPIRSRCKDHRPRCKFTERERRKQHFKVKLKQNIESQEKLPDIGLSFCLIEFSVHAIGGVVLVMPHRSDRRKIGLIGQGGGAVGLLLSKTEPPETFDFAAGFARLHSRDAGRTFSRGSRSPGRPDRTIVAAVARGGTVCSNGSVGCHSRSGP